MKIKRVLGINALCETGTMDKLVDFFRDNLETKIDPEMPWLAQWGHRARVAYLGTENPFMLEISESIDDELPIGRQHKKLAPTFQILGLEVENLDEAIAELRTKGIRVSDKRKIEDPRFEELHECMIHPKSAFGLIIELLEVKEKNHKRESS